jgi:hypothetical protein
MNVVYLRQGLPTLSPDQRDDHASGVILAFVVDDAKKELARIDAAAWPSPCRSPTRIGVSGHSRSATPPA